MSTNVVSVNLPSPSHRPRPITDHVVVGKDILELLAGAMYTNPLNIFREYVQNAADAIDIALDKDLFFQDEPSVMISFDHVERSIKIRDNGVGVPGNNFVQRLTTVGASQKRGKNLRGFRGVGRLSGLGYCQELIFRGRIDGETNVKELKWDGRILREKMRDNNFQGSLSELISSVVSISKLSPTGYPNRFFEVELRKVSRLRNDMLLNEDLVREYLSQVAPVPFSDEFDYGNEVQSFLKSHGIRGPISVVLSDGKGPVLHRVTSKFQLSPNVIDEIRNVDLIKIEDADGDIAAIGWICNHSYFGSLPKRPSLGGVRLRSGNIQVGDDNILSSFFPETRFTGWAIGDIHIISPKILPNGRRDEFEPSTHYSHFQGMFSLHAKKITQIIRERSQQRNRFRSIQQSLSFIQALTHVEAEQPLSDFLMNIISELAIKKLEIANQEVLKLEAESEHYEIAQSKVSEMGKILADVSRRLNKTSISSKLSKEVEVPMATAIRTILTNAKDFREAISLSNQVLKAIQSR